jgi:hypothetical protein
MYIGASSNIEALNVTTLYKPGELGSQIQVGTKAYQLIQVDSGAALSTAGAPVCGTVMYWKDRSKYIVTNDKIQADGATNTNTAPPTVTIANAANSVAGVMCSLSGGAAGTATTTSGNFGVVQQRGNHVGVASDVSFIPGDILVAKQTGAASVAARVAVNTAPPTQPIGRATAATSQVTSGYTPAMLGGWDVVDVP